MSKESREAGLHRVFFSYAGEREQAKRHAPPRQGRFIPEASDLARLLPRLESAPRRMARA